MGTKWNIDRFLVALGSVPSARRHYLQERLMTHATYGQGLTVRPSQQEYLNKRRIFAEVGPVRKSRPIEQHRAKHNFQHTPARTPWRRDAFLALCDLCSR